MLNNIKMASQDVIAASLAECYATIGDRRLNLMQLIDFEANFEKNKSEVPILGKTGKGNRSTGWKGTFSGTMHYNTSVFRELALRYKETGEDIYFEIQVSNDDPTSRAGRQTMVFYGCNLDNQALAKFDADGEYLDEEFEGTFDDFSMPESFKLLPGME